MKTELPKNSQHIKNKLGLIKSKILAVGEGKIDKIILFGSYHEDLLKIFHFDTQEQTSCFELLKSAYVEARYNKNYINTESYSSGNNISLLPA